jgi:hypothetical protein
MKTRWIDCTDIKSPRKSPRALRFSKLKVGDQLVLHPSKNWYRGIPQYAVVTDMWVDPVAGQDDKLKGSMVGYAHVKSDGSIGHKTSTTIRGLASQRYQYADIDYISLCLIRNKKFINDDDVVVDIGRNNISSE